MSFNSFGERISELRKEQGMKREELAQYLNCSVAAVGNYENGNRTPDFETLVKIADKFNVSTDFLLGRSENKTTDINILSICEYTGLSEDSIYTIHYLSEKNKKIIEFFIQSYEIHKILYQFNDFEENLSKAANELKTFCEKYPDYDYWITSSNYNETEIAEDIVKTYDNIQMFYKFAQVNTYEAQRFFLTVMKRYCDSSFEKYNEMLKVFRSITVSFPETDRLKNIIELLNNTIEEKGGEK